MTFLDSLKSMSSAGHRKPAPAGSPGSAAMGQESQQHSSSQGSQSCRDKILHACLINDVPGLKIIFQDLDIHSPHAEITYPAGHEFQPSDPPWTSEMLTVAVREQHTTTLDYLLEIFSDTQISNPIIDAALSHRSIPIWTRLLMHDRSFINNEKDESQSTPFSQACWGAEPELPSLMLEYGADPNVGGFGHISNLTIAMKEQPIGLIKKLASKGAEMRGELVNAVSYNRVDVVKCFLDSGKVPLEEIKAAKVAAEQQKREEIVELLERVQMQD